MPRTGSIKIISALVMVGAILAAFYIVMSERTFFADFVMDKVRDAALNTGSLSISWDAVRGNPLTGIYVSNVIISGEENLIASVDEIGLHVSLITAVSLEPRLSRLSLIGLTAAFTDFSSVNLGQENSAGSFPVESLLLVNSTLETPWGVMNLERGLIELGSHEYKLDLRGVFEDKPFSMEGKAGTGKTDISGKNAFDVSGFKVSLDDMNFSLSGRVMPSLDLAGEIKDLDINKLADYLPFLDNYDLEGLYSTSFYVTAENSADIDSLVASGSVTGRSGRAMGMPFNEISSKFHYSGGLFQIREAAILAFNGKFSCDFDLKLISGEMPMITARFHSEMIDTEGFIPVFPWISFFLGTIDTASGDIAGPLNALSAKARFTSSSLDVASFACSELDANVVIENGSSVSVDFRGIVQGAEAMGTGVISIGEEFPVSADIAIPTIPLESLYSNFSQLADFKVEGAASVNVGIRGPASELSFEVSASSALVDVSSDYRLSDVAVELIYAGDTLGIKSARANWLGASLTAEGSVAMGQGDTSPELALKGGFADLNIAKLGDMADFIKGFNMGGTASGSWFLSGDASRPVSSVEIMLPKFFIFSKHILSDIRAVLDYESPAVILKSSAFRLGNSPVRASGVITLPGANRPIEYNVKGSFEDMDTAAFVSMGLLPQYISGDLAGDARVWKDANDTAPSFRVFFKDSDLVFSDAANLSELNGTVTFSGGGLRFDRLRARVNGENLILDGTAENIMGFARPESVPLNLKVSVAGGDIGRIARMFDPASRGFQGFADIDAAISGNLASPMYTAEGMLSDVSAFGFFLPLINFSGVKGDKDHIEFPDINARVGHGSINAGGSVNIGNNWETNVRIAGTNVDIRGITAPLNEEMRQEIAGSLDFGFEGGGSVANFRGSGTAYIPHLSAFGLNLHEVNADVSIADGIFKLEDSSANIYGGSLTAQMTNDLSRSSWEGTVDVTGADLAPLFADLMPDSEGSITGTANLFLQFFGDTGRTRMQDANGRLEVSDGEISGFEGTEAVSDMVGGHPLRFRAGHFTFTMDGHTIYIMPGSRISAPPEDSVYRYITLDGSVTTQQEVDMSFMGNINIRALNALIAGLQGVLITTVEAGGIGDSGDMVRNFLGDAITGFSRNEFRDVSLRATGKPGDMTFSDVTVHSAPRMDALPSALSNPDGYSEDRGVKLRVEVPVGPGGGDSANGSVGDQLSNQILDQLIRGLIFQGE